MTQPPRRVHAGFGPASLDPAPLQWVVAAYCSVVGGLMLVVPYEFTRAPFAALLPWLPVWGVLFALAGISLVVAATIRPRQPVYLVCHAVAAAALLALAGRFAAVGVWTGLAVYLPMGLVTLAAGWAGPVDEARPTARDLLAPTTALSAAAVGGVLIASAASSSEGQFWFRSDREWFGLLFLASAIAFAIARRRLQRRAGATVLAHFCLGGTMVAFGAAFAVPAGILTGVAYYCGVGIAVGLLPLIKTRLRVVDPGSLRTRLGIALAIAALVPTLAVGALSARYRDQAALLEALDRQRMLAELIASHVSAHDAERILLVSSPSPHTTASSLGELPFGLSWPPDADLAVVVVDGAGRIVAGSSTAAEQAWPAEALEDGLRSTLDARGPGSLRYLEGSLVGFAPVPGTDWIVIARRSADDALARGRIEAAQGFGILLLVGAVAAAAGVAAAGRLVAPLRLLNEGVGRLILGGPTIRTPTTGVTEIRALAQNVCALHSALAAETEARNRREAELRVSLQRQAAIAELGHAAVSNPDTATLFPTACERVRDTMQVDVCEVLELVSSGNALLARASSSHVGPPDRRSTLWLRASVRAQRTLEAVEPMLFERCADGEPDALLDGLAAASTMATPIRTRAGVFGILAVHCLSTRAFPAGAGSFLQATASVLAAAIERERLEEHRTRLAAIVESADDAMLSTTLDGVITSWNRGAERLFGYAAEEVIGKSDWMLIPDDRPGEEAYAMDRIRRGERVDFHDTARLRRDGARIDVSVSVFPIRDAAGTVMGAAMIVRDMRAERARQRAIAEGEKLRALGQMASGVAHDLNQSLALVVGYCELGQAALAARPPRIQSLGETLEIIHRAATTGGETVKRLLTFARAQPVDLKDVVDVGQLLEDVAKLTEPRWLRAAQAEGRPIKLEVLAEAGLRLRGSRASLAEALTNLILNAVDALPGGGQIVLRARRAGDFVDVEVADNGIGMSSAVQRHAFEPFFSTKGERGSGLGLALVFSIVQQHGGEISVNSTPGEGTTFYLSFPLLEDDEAGAGEAASGTEDVAGPRGLRILLVDDEEPLVEMAAQMLARADHEVSTATSAERALERLSAERFDLVVTDMAMGEGMNGWDLARLVNERWPSTRVVLATGWGAAIDALEARARGVAAVVAKPYGVADLQEAIATAMATPGGSVPERGYET